MAATQCKIDDLSNNVKALKEENAEIRQSMGNSEEGNVLHFEDPQQSVLTYSDESKTTVNAGLINTGHICYANAYLQAIASCPISPPCLKMPPNAAL